MKILFIDTVHPLLKQELEKYHHHCDTAYNKKKAEIEETIQNYDSPSTPSHRSRIQLQWEFGGTTFLCSATVDLSSPHSAW